MLRQGRPASGRVTQGQPWNHLSLFAGRVEAVGRGRGQQKLVVLTLGEAGGKKKKKKRPI